MTNTLNRYEAFELLNKNKKLSDFAASIGETRRRVEYTLAEGKRVKEVNRILRKANKYIDKISQTLTNN